MRTPSKFREFREFRHSFAPKLSGILLLLLLALMASPTLRGENAIVVGYGEGAPGDLGVPVIVTATNDLDIHGYSLALSYPAEALEVSSLAVEGTHVAALDPEFVSPRIDNSLGVATLGVIFSFVEPIAVKSMPALQPGAVPRIIARLTFRVRPGATGGSYPLRLVEGAGSPAVFNRFTDAGTSIIPTLTDGTFFVRGGNVLCVDKAIAFPGATTNLLMFAHGQHPDRLTGYSIAILYDCVALDLLEASQTNTDVFAELGNPNRIEFYLSDIDDTIGGGKCRSRTGVIFDFVDPFLGQTLSASPDACDQSLMRYSWRVNAGANAEREFQELFLEDRSGDVSNNFLVGSDSIQPHLVHGKIFFSTGAIVGQVVDIETGLPVEGASVVTEPDGFEALSVNNGAFAIEDVIPGTYKLKVDKDGYYTALSGEFELLGRNTAVNIPVRIYKVPGDIPVTTFKRGFINADARFDISDAVTYLNWLFKGGEPPVCMQAADINNDDRTDISDPIFFLNFLFVGGSAPEEPFVNCGPDSSELTCEMPVGCP